MVKVYCFFAISIGLWQSHLAQAENKIADSSIQEIELKLYYPQDSHQLPDLFFARIKGFNNKTVSAEHNLEPIIQTLSAVNDYLSQAELWQDLATNDDLDWQKHLPVIFEIETSARDMLAQKHIKTAERLLRKNKTSVADMSLVQALNTTKSKELRDQIESRMSDLSAAKNIEPFALPIINEFTDGEVSLPFKFSPFSTTDSTQLYLALSYIESKRWTEASDLLRIFRNKPASFFYNSYLQLISRHPNICELDRSVCESDRSVEAPFELGGFQKLTGSREYLIAYQSFYKYLCGLSECKSNQPLLFAHSSRMLRDETFVEMLFHFVTAVDVHEETGKWSTTEESELLKVFTLLHQIYVVGSRPPEGARALPISNWDQITYWHCVLLVNLNQRPQAKTILNQAIKSGAVPSKWLERAGQL